MRSLCVSDMVDKVSHFASRSLTCVRANAAGVVKGHEPDQPLLLLALTLRGPSGGHCVELHFQANLERKQWARRAHCLLVLVVFEFRMKAPRSGRC
jgi:hypothetical protein